MQGVRSTVIWQCPLESCCAVVWICPLVLEPLRMYLFVTMKGHDGSRAIAKIMKWVPSSWLCYICWKEGCSYNFVAKVFALLRGHFGRGKNEGIPGAFAAKVACSCTRGATTPPLHVTCNIRPCYLDCCLFLIFQGVPSHPIVAIHLLQSLVTVGTCCHVQKAGVHTLASVCIVQ